MMRDIMEVPLPRACSRRLMSFFTFQISIFFSASLACGALMVSESEEYCHSKKRFDLWRWYDECSDQSACESACAYAELGICCTVESCIYP